LPSFSRLPRVPACSLAYPSLSASAPIFSPVSTPTTLPPLPRHITPLSRQPAKPATADEPFPTFHINLPASHPKYTEYDRIGKKLDGGIADKKPMWNYWALIKEEKWFRDVKKSDIFDILKSGRNRLAWADHEIKAASFHKVWYELWSTAMSNKHPDTLLNIQQLVKDYVKAEKIVSSRGGRANKGRTRRYQDYHREDVDSDEHS